MAQRSYPEFEDNPEFTKIKCPCRLFLIGPSESGKSTFILNAVKHEESVFTESFRRILYCCPPEHILDKREDFIQKIQA